MISIKKKLIHLHSTWAKAELASLGLSKLLEVYTHTRITADEVDNKKSNDSRPGNQRAMQIVAKSINIFLVTHKKYNPNDIEGGRV